MIHRVFPALLRSKSGYSALPFHPSHAHKNPPAPRRPARLLFLAAALAAAPLAWPTANAAQVPESYIAATNGDWNTPANWSAPGVVPINAANTYAVTINGIGNVYYDVTGTNSIDTLDLSNSGLTLESGDNLTVTGAAVLTNATITANSANFIASDTTNFDGANLFATDSGIITLGTATSFATANTNVNESLIANGATAQLNLTALTSINLQSFATLFVQANNGGTVDLSNLTTITHTGARGLDFQVYGAGSTLKIATLGAAGMDGITMDVQNGGTVLWASPSTLINSTLEITGAATINTSFLTHMDGDNLTVSAGGTLSLPSLTTFTTINDNVNEQFESTGASSQLNLAGLTTLNLAGQATLFVQAQDGGTVDLSTLAAINRTGTRTLSFQIYGTDSTLKIAALGAAGIDNVYLDVRNGGTVLWGTPTTFTNSELDVTGTVTLDTSHLSDLDSSNVYVYAGGSVSLPALTTFTTINANANEVLESTGAGALLTLANLATLNLAGQATLYIQANNGGTIDLSSLATLNHTGTRALSFQVYGTNSTLKIAALGAAGIDSVYLDVRDGGTVLWGTPTTFTNSELDVTGAVSLDTSHLSDIDSSNVYVYAGGSVSLPALTTFTTLNNNAIEVLEANGAGALLTLANLTTINLAGQATLYVQANSGGTIDLRSLATLNRTGTRGIDFQVYGAGSTLNITALGTAGIDRVRLDIQNGGTVLWGAPTTFTNSELDVTGAATFDTSHLSDIDASNVYIYAGGSVSLPALTTYTAANANVDQVLQSNGAGAQLTLDHLTTLNLAGQAGLYVQADNGGTLDLSSLATLNRTGTRGIDFQVYGAGSTLKIPALGAAGLDKVTLDIQNGGTVLWGAATHFTNSQLLITGAATLDTSSLSDITGSNLSVTGAGSLALPVLTAYTAANANVDQTFASTGAGSLLSLPALSTLHLPGSAGVFIEAFNGATTSLPSLTTFDAAGGTRSVAFRSYNANSKIVLTGLLSMPSDAELLDIQDHGSVEMGAFSDPFTLHFRANFNNGLGDLDVYYNGALIEDITPNNFGTWETYDYTLNDPGLPFGPDPVITFTADGPNAAVAVDEYQATEIAPTPEPASLALLGLGAAALLSSRKRRRKTA